MAVTWQCPLFYYRQFKTIAHRYLYILDIVLHTCKLVQNLGPNFLSKKMKHTIITCKKINLLILTSFVSCKCTGKTTACILCLTF